MERLCAHAAELLKDERAVILCGDWNVLRRTGRVLGSRDAA